MGFPPSGSVVQNPVPVSAMRAASNGVSWNEPLMPSARMAARQAWDDLRIRIGQPARAVGDVPPSTVGNGRSQPAWS